MKAGCAQIASGPFLQPRGGFTMRLVQLQLRAFTIQGPFQGLAMCLPAQGFCEMCKRKIFLCLFVFKRASKLCELQAHSSLDLPLLWLGGALCPDVGATLLHVLREVSSHPVDLVISWSPPC